MPDRLIGAARSPSRKSAPANGGGAVKYLSLAILALAFMAADARGAPKEDVPLPRPRPTDLHGPKSPPPESGKSDEHEKPARDEACLERLKAAGFTFEPATPHAASNPACVIDTPVKLVAVPIASRLGASVRLPEEHERELVRAAVVEDVGPVERRVRKGLRRA